MNLYEYYFRKLTLWGILFLALIFTIHHLRAASAPKPERFAVISLWRHVQGERSMELVCQYYGNSREAKEKGLSASCLIKTTGKPELYKMEYGEERP